MDIRWQKYGFTLIPLVFTVTTHATTYKWIDEDGKVHFSDSYHPNATIQKLPSAQGPSSLQRQNAQDNLTRLLERQQRMQEIRNEEKQEAQERKLAEKQKAEQLKKQCLTMRDELRVYKDGYAIYKLDENGERAYLNDQQRNKDIEKLSTDIASYCN
jgi:exonuclease VII large subunit